MFECRLAQASLLRKVLEAIRDLVTEANFEVSPSQMALQAMDSSHVSLVALTLRGDGFEQYRCDRSFSMGMNLNNMSKMFKCAGANDSVHIKAEDNGDVVTFLFESEKGDRVSEFELKLMDISSENLGIPETEYAATVKMPSSEYQRIVKDLATIGDTVEISVTKDGVRFSTSGDIGSANVICRENRHPEKDAEPTVVEMNEPVSLTFALRYLNSFAKATSLSSSVTIRLSKELPVVVEYKIPEIGHVRYYLAPKIEDEDMEDGQEG